jgi:hypothetical protein
MSVGFAPAICIGIGFVFFVGYIITGQILNLVDILIERVQFFHNRKEFAELLSSIIYEYWIIFSIIGGTIPTAFAVYYLLSNSTNISTTAWYALTILGYAGGFLSFILASSKNARESLTPKRRNPQKKSRRMAEHKQNDKTDPNIIDGEFKKESQKNNSRSRKSQSKYQKKLTDLSKKQEERKDIQKDLYAIFRLEDHETQTRIHIVADFLNRYFQFSGIVVQDNFEPLVSPNQNDKNLVEGIIDYEGNNYLVVFEWCEGPFCMKEVSHLLVRAFNQGFHGVILMTNSNITQAAITTCKDALSQKVIILFELKEVIDLLEKGGNFLELFKMKMTAAQFHANPFFTELN